MLRVWPALLLMGIAMVAVQAVLAVNGLWNLAGFGAGLAGMAVGALVAQLPRFQRRGQGAPALDQDQFERPRMSLGLALAPYLLLIVVVTAAELWPWAHEVLNQDQNQIQVAVPELRTNLGWTTPAGMGRTISVFGHAGALLAYVSIASFVVYWLARLYSPGVAGRIVKRTVRSAVPSSIGIVSMVGFAMVMYHSGMTYVLAMGLGKAAGPLYPLVAPFIGLLGAFMTGSNTNSNVVFAPLQQQAADLLYINALVILAAQTTGGALGSMIAPAKLIVGCSTAGLAGQEGSVLKRTLPPALIITAVVGALALAAVWLGGAQQ
jgi:lactate permease